MKKIRFSILALTLLVISSVWGQNPFTEFKIGFLAPSGAEKGLFFGVNSGRMIDEALSWSVSLDMYSKSYSKSMEIDTIAGVSGSVNEINNVTEIENSTLYLPLLIRLNYEKNLPSGFVVRGGAGIGYAFLWANEDNYRDNIEETRFYSGLTYRFSGGVGLQISSSANLLIDLEYNGGEVSRDKGKNSAGLPVRAAIDMSGLGIRVGVSIFNFGF